MTAPAEWRYDQSLDTAGLRCPLPVLKARKQLLAMRRGQRLLVTATDPLSPVDFPNFCREAGHTLVASDNRDGGYRFLIERR